MLTRNVRGVIEEPAHFFVPAPIVYGVREEGQENHRAAERDGARALSGRFMGDAAAAQSWWPRLSPCWSCAAWQPDPHRGTRRLRREFTGVESELISENIAE
jgi:hypothetical protein